MKRRSTSLLTVAAFGYAFLYLPIVSVVIYSFNDSRLVTLWGGVRETRWNGQAPYRDRFTAEAAGEAAAELHERVAALGIERAAPVVRDDLLGQLALDAKVLAPVRAALARGEIVRAASGLRGRPSSCFVRVHDAERLAALLEAGDAPIAAAAHLAQVVPPIERHVRFRASGSLNGYPVEHAREPLGDTMITLCVLRDAMGMPKLACGTADECWWRRRESPWDEWEESEGLTPESVMRVLRRHNVLGAAPEPLAMDEAALVVLWCLRRFHTRVRMTRWPQRMILPALHSRP